MTAGTPLTVVQLGKYYPPHWGGVEMVTRDLALGFVARGWRSVVVAFDTRHQTGLEEAVIVDRRPMLADVKSQPISLSWLRQAFRRLREADVLVVHMPNFLAIPVMLAAGRRSVILFWHSDVVNKGLIGRLTRPLDAWMVRRATAIWVTTRDYGSGSDSLRNAQGKTELLTLGIADPLDSDAGAPLPGPIAALADGRPIVLSVGRLVPYKGFDQLLRAWARVASPAVLVIAGHGAQRDRLQAMIDELGLGERVMLAGRMTQDELHALFRAATLYVMSSVGRTEAFGVVQIEAMAFSLPIVATDVPRSGVAWVSERGALGGLVPINDPPALAAAIDRVLASDRLPELRAASRARYERLFRVDQMVATAAGTIARLAETNPGARPAEVTR